MMNYIIEKNIPIPPFASRKSKWKLLATKMEVGDSVLVETKYKAQTLRDAIVRLGYDSHGIKEDDKFRIWKGQLKSKKVS